MATQIEYAYSSPDPDSDSELTLLPVPYYRAQLGCGLATTRMLLAYALYPQEPPSEHEIAVEARLDTTQHPIPIRKDEKQPLFHRRGLRTYLNHEWGFRQLRHSISQGFPVELTVKGTIVTLSSTQAHAVIAVGYNATGIFIHDPSSRRNMQPCNYYDDSQLRKYWAWEGNFWGLEIMAKPQQTPMCTIQVSLTDEVSPVRFDGEIMKTNIRRFPIGTSHIIQVDSATATAKEDVSITYTCYKSSVRVIGWTTSTIQLDFEFQKEVLYLIRIIGSTGNRNVWVSRWGPLTVNAQEPTTPRGVLGVMQFDGWYSEDRLLTTSQRLHVRVSEPMVIEERWRQDYSYLILAVVLVALVLLCLCAYYKYSYRNNNK